MSYILDALKRADADRERGHVPGLHSQGENHPATSAGAPWRSPALGVMAVVVLFTAAALTWWSLRTPDASEPKVVQPAAIPTVPVVADAAPPSIPSLPILTPEPPIETQTLTPIQAPSVPQRPQPSPATAEAQDQDVEADAEDMVDNTTEVEDTVDEVATQPPLPSPSPQSTLPPRPAAPRPMATVDASGRPSVKVSGSSYSQNPAHRMLIANGKLVHEGQEIEPGLKLETVGPRSAVLNHRGTLYNITY